MSIRVQKNNEKGAVIVLVAVMLVLILTCVAFVVDLGHIHNVKVGLQEAVDAAALAGAAKLDGTSGQIQGAKDVAIATARANGVTEVSFTDSECETSATDSCIGTWDAEALGSNAAARWTQTETSPDAILVRATRAVGHIFFFFGGSTTVTADAIAVATPYNPVLPLALVSCAPTDQIANHPGSLPGMTICDIKSYTFNNDQDDIAAWTSLTFDVSANEVSNYMEPGTGREQFNQVVFGKGLDPPNYGIENTAVDPGAKTFSTSYEGCRPDGLDIPCGLGGKINGLDIAPPGDFPVPSAIQPLNQDSTTGVYSATSFDPMTGYANNGYLPRWYNMDPAADFQDNDHFTRVWSQDGILLIGNDPATGGQESFAAYQARLTSYRNGTVKPYGDDRFVAGAGTQGDIIESYTGNTKNKILASLQSAGVATGNPSSILFPAFRVVPQYAGYPKVYVFNGTAASILADFLANPDVTDADSNLKCRQDIDLPPGEHALIVNVPVIFAGACETWKAISNASPKHTLSYVGMAKLLLTRAWKNPDAYDCGSNFVNVTTDMGGNSCDLSVFDPPPGSGNDLSEVTAHIHAIEGVSLFPIPDTLARQASLLKVELVE